MNSRSNRSLRALAASAIAAVVLLSGITPAVAGRPEALPARTLVQGTVAWTGRDARATLIVIACRRTTEEPCADMRTAPVTEDGHYRLALSSGTWAVAPLVDAAGSRWSTPATELTLPRTPRPLNLSIAARVVRLRVVDESGNPYPPATDGSGGFAGVVFCEVDLFPWACPDTSVGMGVGVDHDGDGWLLLVTGTDPTYRFSGYARTAPNFMDWSYSEPYISTGAALDEDHVFVVP